MNLGAHGIPGSSSTQNCGTWPPFPALRAFTRQLENRPVRRIVEPDALQTDAGDLESSGSVQLSCFV